MYEQTNMVLCGDVVVAESALLKRVRKDRYGSVAGLDVLVKRPSDHFKRCLSSKNKPLFLQAYYLHLTLFNAICDYLTRHLVFWE